MPSPVTFGIFPDRDGRLYSDERTMMTKDMLDQGEQFDQVAMMIQGHMQNYCL